MQLQARINLERRIVRRLVRSLLAAGYKLNVANGGDGYELPAFSADFSTVMGALFACDSEHIVTQIQSDTYGHGDQQSFVFLVYGNDGWDVVNDYGLSLEPVLGPINQWTDKLAAVTSRS